MDERLDMLTALYIFDSRSAQTAEEFATALGKAVFYSGLSVARNSPGVRRGFDQAAIQCYGG